MDSSQIIGISVVVCTYNRSKLLERCLQGFTKQDTNRKFEVIVVDNASNDTTYQVTSAFVEKYSNFRYVYEAEIGLSAARNKGFQTALYDIVAYCDDDGIPHSDFIRQIVDAFESSNFAAIGGRFLPYYDGLKPKWLPPTFGSNREVRSDFGEMPPGSFICGGIMAFRKHVLTQVGGFDTNVGMTGNKIAWGEDNLIQKNIMKLGYAIGFNPFWKIDHLVAKAKYKLSWHLRSEYAAGRDSIRIDPKKKISVAIWLGVIGYYGIVMPFFLLFKFEHPKLLIYKWLKRPVYFTGRLIEHFNREKSN